MPHGIQDVQYEANAPTEDRLVIKELEHKEGYLLGVFDGHGGGLLVRINLHRLNKLQKESTVSSRNTMTSLRRMGPRKRKP